MSLLSRLAGLLKIHRLERDVEDVDAARLPGARAAGEF
jgi:hypothetical protein